MHAPHPAQHALYSAPPPTSFREYYASRLRELTFNSRPIIQDLSMQAMAQRDQNNWPEMQALVEELELAIFRVSSFDFSKPLTTSI
jgi:pre-mRNA cleavage complex 2 protein Pcf11